MNKQYRKKPIVIEAVHLTQQVNPEDVAEWCNGKVTWPPSGSMGQCVIEIPTLEGKMTAQLEDYIIKGVKNEFYPCKPDIFEATYEPVAPTTEPSNKETMSLRTDNVSKSNGTEIIAILYFILATQISYKPFQVLAIVMGVINMLESIVWAFVFKASQTHKPTTEPSNKGEME